MAKKNTNTLNLDLTQDRLFPLGVGIVTCVVCAPKSWTAERISEQVTHDNPPGTTLNKWIVAKQQPKPLKNNQCPDDKNRIHVLLNC